MNPPIMLQSLDFHPNTGNIRKHAGPFGTKAGTKSVTKNGGSLESGAFEDW